MSARPSDSLPSNCSGAMYCNVPRIVPSCVRFGLPATVGSAVRPDGGPPDATALASPKSSNFTPDLVSITLPGLVTRRKVSGQNLNGDDPLEPRVLRLVDLAHSASSEGGKDFVWPEPSAGWEGHVQAGILSPRRSRCPSRCPSSVRRIRGGMGPRSCSGSAGRVPPAGDAASLVSGACSTPIAGYSLS